MEGKVKYVRRNVWYEGNEEYAYDHDIHARRCSCTYAVLYNGDEVIMILGILQLMLLPALVRVFIMFT